MEEGEVVVILGPSDPERRLFCGPSIFSCPRRSGTITIDGLTVDSQKHHRKETLALRRKPNGISRIIIFSAIRPFLQNITKA